ncbi:MAG: hypothetical protein WAU45_07335 [Blastocatellia bacterium]
MNAEALIRDPVFQLNILLWMAKEQPTADYRVRPLFFELRFRIIYIEQPFPLPEETASAAQLSALRINVTPQPELILGRELNGKALYFEAKADSFSPDSSTSKQARGHLLAAGPAFGEVLAPLTSCLLCYLVPDDRRTLMCECLTDLANELSAEGLEPGSFSCHGLRITERQLTYVFDSTFQSYAGLREASVPVLELLEDNTDPNPLLLIYSDEDCPDSNRRDFYRRALIEQVRARLLCDLQTLGIHAEYVMAADELLLKTTDGTFQYLGRERQKRLRVLVRENVLKRIRDYWKDKQRGVGLEANVLRVRWDSAEEKDAFLGWLEDRRVKFEVSRPADEGPTLFDSLPEII